jgi:hypothetical protein
MAVVDPIRETLVEIGDKLHYNLVVDNADIHNYNDMRKKEGTNGFTKERCFQHIGSVPCEIWHRHCMKIGYYEMDGPARKKEIIKFLNEFKGWSPVENIRTRNPNDQHIIVK